MHLPYLTPNHGIRACYRNTALVEDISSGVKRYPAQFFSLARLSELCWVLQYLSISELARRQAADHMLRVPHTCTSIHGPAARIALRGRRHQS